MATSSGGTAYSDQQVYALLQRSGLESFTFDWLDQNLIYRADLTPYVLADSLPHLAYDSTQAVPRSLTFRTLGKPATLNPLTDLVRPHYRLLAPDGGWLDWVLGTFPLNPPRKTITEGYSFYDWSSADLADWLVQDQFTRSYSLPAGSDAIAGVQTILASFNGPSLAVLIPGSNRSLALRNSLSWDAGKSKLEAINDVLGAVSYRPAWFNEMGELCSSEIPDYNLEAPSWSWDATAGNSVLLSSGGFVETPDVSNAVNFCQVIGEDPRIPASGTPAPIYASYENTRPDSPISTAILRRRLVKVIRDSKIVDQVSAQIRARAEVQTGAQIYGTFTVATLPWPAWANGGYPLIHLSYTAADEGTADYTYLVQGWSWNLGPGEMTSHTLKRVVQV